MISSVHDVVFPEAPPERSRDARVEGKLKVTGQLVYAADLALAGLLHVVTVRSSYPHARILSIDTTEAKKVPGVHAVLIGADVAALRFGRNLYDVPILAVEKVRFIGEMVAAVAAESREIAEEAARLIDVAYEPLPAVFDPIEALSLGAPAVHDAPWSYKGAARGEDGPINLMGRAMEEWGGDIEVALAASDRVFEHTFRTQSHHHGYLEPHSCTVNVEKDGRVNIWSNNKSPYALRAQISGAFDIPQDMITLHSPAIGGDFGGKGSPMDVPLCLELARLTGRPVSMTMRYSEELTAASVRHASVTKVRVGVSDHGRLQAMDVYTVYNSGAYGGFKPGVNFNASRDAGSSYNIPVVRAIADRVYTNQIPGGNTRAPGGPQMVFAVESMLDLVARELGIDAFTFRRNNLLRHGEVGPFGTNYDEVRGLATLDLAERSYCPVFPQDAPRSLRFGRGVAVYDRPTHPPGRTSVRLRLKEDGTVEVQVPVMETGTGSHTILRRIVAEALQMPLDEIVIRYVGTDDLPFDGGVGASRVSISVGEGAHVTALEFREELKSRMASTLNVPMDRIELRAGCIAFDAATGRRLDLQSLARTGTKVELVQETGQQQGHEGVTGFNIQVAQVGVDVETGQVFLYEILSVNDVAEILDPIAHEGQIQGGIVTGIGFALTEDLGIQDGRVTAAHLGDYKLPAVSDAAPIRVVLLKGGMGAGARNIKSIGETTNVPTAAAIANAVADAVGVRVSELPITAEKVYRLLHQQDISLNI